MLRKHGLETLDTFRERLATDGTLVIAVKVIPRCSRSEVSGVTAEGVLQAKLAAIPEKGKANEELRRLLAAVFGAPKTRVEILSGTAAAHKRIRISR